MQRKTKIIDNALVVSSFYGFEYLNIEDVEHEHHSKGQKTKTKADFKHSHLPHLEEYVSVLSHVHKQDKKDMPFLYYTKGNIKTLHSNKKTKNIDIGLHVIGTLKSIAEAMLIKTAFAILKEEGYKDITLEINSLGSRDSQNQYNKALTAFFRSKLSELDKESKELLKFGGHTLLSEKPKGIMNLLNEIPASIDFLSEESRTHFKEVIEYLESQQIPFEINKTIAGDPHYSTHTVFTIIDTKTKKILATGTRYDDLSKKVISRSGYPAVSINITLSKLQKSTEAKKPNFDKCDIYFIQLGYAAKLKSLEVVEMLRKSGIAVHQSIGRDKMATQTNSAHKKNVKYILIMGQKEAIENSICVRDLDSNSQKTVKLDDLVTYIKNIKVKNKK